MKMVFLDKASLGDDLDYEAFNKLLPGWSGYATSTSENKQQRCKDAEIIITNKVVIDRNFIEHADCLKLICVAATGVNNIDMNAAVEKAIPVCNVRGYATASVVEHVFGLMINLQRHMADYQAAVNDGRWSQSEHFCYHGERITELAGKTLGIVGYGELGKAVARLAQALSMKVLISQRPGTSSIDAERVVLEQLLIESDIVSLHCPLTTDTHHLMNAHAFDLMPPHSVLINTARGELINEKDLIEALTKNKIAGAAIDVLSQEPPVSDHKLLNLQLPNLIITPHVAWASVEARQRMVHELAENIRYFLQGRSRNQVILEI